ncbi:hypothetical protein [Paenibacillus sp. FSL P4-0288]|uniref:hypothetical protein n=1 Tax=Paenibacillus sp. FSL P4-0288 TaxID=2921633 RepID=UPI0030F9E9EB
MSRYVLKTNANDFIKWIQWTAGVVPTIGIDSFDKSMIIDDDFLNYEIDLTGKTRKELLNEYHPNVEIVKVKVELA